MDDAVEEVVPLRLDAGVGRCRAGLMTGPSRRRLRRPGQDDLLAFARAREHLAALVERPAELDRPAADDRRPR